MRRPDKAGGKAAKAQRRKTLRRRNTAKAARRRKPAAADANEKIALLIRERDEALAQQVATSEVLKVISSSPGELEPVFEAILEKATRICEAKFGVLYRYRDDLFRPEALVGVPPSLAEFIRKRGSFVPPRGIPLDRLLLTKKVVHTVDAAAEQVPPPSVTLAGGRTHVAVPMLKNNELVGAIIIYRQEVRPFTAKQIELVQNFAAQSVIAIENTRLIKELRQRTDDLSESLGQQTATSDVLKVISSSPGDLEPVFQAMLENATRICEAKFGLLHRYDNGMFQTAAVLNAPPAFAEHIRQRGSFLPPVGTPLDRLLQSRDVIYTADDTAKSNPGVAARLGGARSLVAVPMLKEKNLIGAIVIYRQEVRPFTDKQIELVTNFAAQAVIAIENTRLLKELRQRTDDLTESLGQQTATSDVLKVISSSPGELEPVFDAMLANAVHICGASFGVLFRLDDGEWRAAAMFGVPPAFAEFWQRGPQRAGPRTALGRVAETRQTVHIADVTTEPAYIENKSVFVAAVNLGGFRTILNVPMLKDDELIGAFAIYRQEVRPFTDKQIELVQNFAAQAVIAIENTRLLNELRRISSAADRHRRRAQGHQQLARPTRAGVQGHAGERHPHLRGRVR